jgi:hypothetical protein
LKALSIFVLAGGDVNEADYDGRTALHLATGTQCSDFYQFNFLCRHCVRFSMTAFFYDHHFFADQKQKEVMEFLLKAGAKRLPDRWGNVPQ